MVDVLSAKTPIVDDDFHPTREFMIKWSQLAANLSTIVPLSTPAQVSAVFDVIGAGVNDMLVRGTTQWGVLAPGVVGQILSYQSGGPTWEAAPALATLTDVVLTAPANNDVLTYVSGAGKWENKPSSGGGGGGWYLTPPVASSLTAFQNLGTGTVFHQRTSGAVPSLAVDGGSGGASTLFCAMQTAPGGTFSAVVKVKFPYINALAGWYGAGLGVYNSGNGKAESCFVQGQLVWYSIDWSSLTSTSSLNNVGTLTDPDFFLHLDYDGTNLNFGISRNGIDKYVSRFVNVAGTIGAITHVGPVWGEGGTILYTFEHFWVGALGTSGILP